MTMTGIDLLGFAAGTLTTCAFWPQLQKTWTVEICRRCITWYARHILERGLSLVPLWTGATFVADHCHQFHHVASDRGHSSAQAALPSLTGC